MTFYQVLSRSSGGVRHAPTSNDINVFERNFNGSPIRNPALFRASLRYLGGTLAYLCLRWLSIERPCTRVRPVSRVMFVRAKRNQNYRSAIARSEWTHLLFFTYRTVLWVFVRIAFVFVDSIHSCAWLLNWSNYRFSCACFVFIFHSPIEWLTKSSICIPPFLHSGRSFHSMVGLWITFDLLMVSHGFLRANAW